jgi:hypothetical protein
MKAKSELIRQGDVCLIPVAALPKGAIAVAQKDARVVLAYGEVTGHERFLQVLEPVTLRHEEHTHKVIPPGIYHLPKQMEYTAAELVRVTD